MLTCPLVAGQGVIGTRPYDAHGFALQRDTGGHVEVERAAGRGRFIFLCEHASAHVPDELNGLGLADEVRLDHCGWDIGALAVAQRLVCLPIYPLFAVDRT